MKIDAQLDYQKILAGKDQSVNLVVKFTAAKREDQRKTAMAFCVVLDRSGSNDHFHQNDWPDRTASVTATSSQKEDNVRWIATSVTSDMVVDFRLLV